jgi:outer membrane lipoprotein-sorting protein
LKIVFTTLKKILFWSYDRGTWQYDVMCVLILAFIFLTPNWLFESHRKNQNRDVLVWSDQGDTGTGAWAYRSETANLVEVASWTAGADGSSLIAPEPLPLSNATTPVSVFRPGAQGNLDELLSKMQAAGRAIKTYQAKVVQEKRHTQIGGREIYRGELAFRHEPQNRDKVRIRYYDSNGAVNQEVLIDGDRIILYQPKIGQAIETSRKAQAQKNPEYDFIATPYSSVSSLKQHYSISYPRDENVDSASTAVLELVPKVHGSITGYTLWIDKSSWLPIRYRAAEQNGDTTTLAFSDIKINPKLPGDIFKLDLPKGTNIVHK